MERVARSVAWMEWRLAVSHHEFADGEFRLDTVRERPTEEAKIGQTGSFPAREPLDWTSPLPVVLCAAHSMRFSYHRMPRTQDVIADQRIGR